MESERAFPHVGYEMFFEFDQKSSEKSNIFYAKCKLCPDGKKPLSAAMDSACNLNKHIEVGPF